MFHRRSRAPSIIPAPCHLAAAVTNKAFATILSVPSRPTALGQPWKPSNALHGNCGKKDELDTALGPCVVGISELDHIGRPFPNKNDKATILNAIVGRCRQLQRGQTDGSGPTIRVHPLHGEDKALAWVTCVALARRNYKAVLNDDSALAAGDQIIIATNGILNGSLVTKAAAIIGGMDADDRIGLQQVLNTESDLDFLA